MRFSCFLFAFGLVGASLQASASGVPHRAADPFETRYTVTERTIDGHPARCVEPEPGLRVCNITYQNARGPLYYELRVQQGERIVAKFLTSATVYSKPDFDAGFLPAPNGKLLIVSRETGGGNDFLLNVNGFAVFSSGKAGYKLDDYFLAHGFPSLSGFFVQGPRLYFEESNWVASSALDAPKGAGTYLAASWYRWNRHHFERDATQPISARRMTHQLEKALDESKDDGYRVFEDADAHHFLFAERKRYFNVEQAAEDFPGLFGAPERETVLGKCALDGENATRQFSLCAEKETFIPQSLAKPDAHACDGAIRTFVSADAAKKHIRNLEFLDAAFTPIASDLYAVPTSGNTPDGFDTITFHVHVRQNGKACDVVDSEETERHPHP